MERPPEGGTGAILWDNVFPEASRSHHGGGGREFTHSWGSFPTRVFFGQLEIPGLVGFFLIFCIWWVSLAYVKKRGLNI